MYLLYVDESGDPGITNSPTKHFILSAIVIHELRWKDVLSSLVDFRKQLKVSKGLKLREEIHCSELINRPGELRRIPRNERVDIIKKCIVWLNNQPDISIFSVCVNKANKKSDVFEIAWTALIQRFENTIEAGNFNGPRNDHERGIILSDDTDSKRLTKLVRKMRHYNTIPNDPMHGLGYRDLTLKYIVEDPIFRNSANSLMHQMNDVLAYCARQVYEPNSYMRKKSGHLLYSSLSSVLIKKVTRKNNHAIVEL